MTQFAAPLHTWDEDPEAASLLLSLGRVSHDALIVATPQLLSALEEEWGQPRASVKLSFLPGIPAPTRPGHDDRLASYEREGVNILVARGHSALHEGASAHAVTALARLAAHAGVRGALLATTSHPLKSDPQARTHVISDHISLGGVPLFPSPVPVVAQWDQALVSALNNLDGVGAPIVAALSSGPLAPGPAERALLSGMGADAVVFDTVAPGMLLASRGVRTVALAFSQVESQTLEQVSAQDEARAATLLRACQVLLAALQEEALATKDAA